MFIFLDAGLRLILILPLFDAIQDVAASLETRIPRASEDSLQCDVEDLGSCVRDVSVSLLQSKIEVLNPSEALKVEQFVGAQGDGFGSKAGASGQLRQVHNVLFIVADDLRHLVSAVHPDVFGYAHTPNLDIFMKESLVLNNSHAQQATCTPSRTSVLFGRRPDTMHVWMHQYDDVRQEACATCMTIPGLFKEAGYYTVGMGKVFGETMAKSGVIQDPQSWSDAAFSGDNWFFGEERYDGESDPSWQSVNENETGQCQDSEVRDHAVRWLRNLTGGGTGQPWFLAVGFRKPHSPFAAPKEFFDLYDPNEVKLVDNPFAPWDMPPIAHFDSVELRDYPDIEAIGFSGGINETLPAWKAREEVRGYQASVSYFDHNVGVLLNEVKALGHWNDTIVILWSDHGFKLGHHAMWGKETNFYEDTNAPVILRVPGLTDGGITSNALVEHVDLMATLVDAAGLNPLPTCPVNKPWLTSHCTEGKSWLKLALSPATVIKPASHSQFIRKKEYMGYSLTAPTYRFTAWVDWDEVAQSTNFSMQGRDCGIELYDHNADPQENYNLAYRPEYNTLVEELFVKLKLGY